MSDADGDPGPSRNTRRNGGNPPGKAAVAKNPPAMAKKQEERSQSRSTEVSQASASTTDRDSKEPEFLTKAAKALFVPDYGGKFFTAPTSSKRQSISHRRWSPDLTPTRQKMTAAQRLGEAAAAFEKEPSVDTKIRNLKDTVPRLISMKDKLRILDFSLHPRFGGKPAELYRKFPKGQVGSSASSSDSVQPTRSKSTMGNRRLPALPPPASKSTIGELAAFDFASPAVAAPAVTKTRSKSSGGMNARVKTEDEEEEEEAPQPQRGRARTKAQTPQSTRGAKTVRVKEEAMEHSDSEEAQPAAPVVAQTGRRSGRKSVAKDTATAPAPVAPASVVGGRRKSEARTVVVKEEPIDEEKQPQQARARRHSNRGGEGAQAMKAVVKTEPADEEEAEEKKTEETAVPMTRGRRRSDKGEEAPLADAPSTSAAADAADRSTSRKRARPVASTAEPVADRRQSDKLSPPTKKAAMRRSTDDQSAAESDEAEEKEEVKEDEEEVKEEEQEQGAKKVVRRRRRTKAEILADAQAAEAAEAAARGEVKKEPGEGMTTRRRSSFRGAPAPDAAPAAPAADASTIATSRLSPRVPKTPPTAKPKPKPTWVVEADKKREEPESKELVVDHFAFEDDDDQKEEEEEEESGRTPKGSARKGKKDASSASSSMMLDESAAAELSGYEEGSGDELVEFPTIHSGGEKKEEEEGEEPVATSATPETPEGEQPKRGRGRPKKDGTPAVPRPKVDKHVEPVTPMARERRSTAQDPNVAQFLASGGKRIRAAGGGGTASPGGLSLSVAAARVKAPTPPAPVVKAAPGSALSIMRDLRGGNKKKLPSMRSPSPAGPSTAASRAASRSSMSKLAAAAATLADAPPLSRPPSSASTKSKESSATPQPGTSVEPPKQGEAVVPKEEEAKDEKKKEEEASQPGSSQEKAKEAPTYDDDTLWITPNNLKGEKLKLPPPLPPPTRWITPDNIITGVYLPEEEEQPLPPPADKEKEKEAKEAGKKDQEKAGEKKAEEGTEAPSESAAKKEETAQDLLARWAEQRRAIDAEHAEAGVPVLPVPVGGEAPPPPAPIRQSARRSVAAPARFGDYDLNYGDVRKRSATIGGAPAALSPAVTSTSDVGSKQAPRRRKDDRTPSVAKEEAGGEEEEKPSSSRKGSRSKKADKRRPRLTLKIKLGTGPRGSGTPSTVADDNEEAGGEEEAEGAEEHMDDDVFDDATSEGTSIVSAATTATTSAAAPKTGAAASSTRKRDKKGRIRNRAFPSKRWKHTPVPHMGFIELENKIIESVTLSCAQTIDAMLLEICDDGVQKSTLVAKEQASEHSRLSARRLAITRPPPAATPVKTRPVNVPIPPREERTKRVRHAPQSKEYDNLSILLATGGPEPMNSPTSFSTLAGFAERKPAERRKESRQDAASKKASTVAVHDPADANENEVPVVEKSKKERRRDREREERQERREREEAVRAQKLIPYSELLRKKAHNAQRLPGRVLVDPNEFFYREIFTDDLGDGIPDAVEPDVVAFDEPVPDDTRNLQPNVAIGVLAEEVAAKLLAVLPRPPPYPDEDDDDEDEREWAEADLKRALSHHSASRRDLLDKALVIVNSQRMGNLVVEGQKGAQDVLYNLHVKHALRLKELFPVFSEFRRAESVWLHKSLIRLLPSYLLPVYLEICRFLRYIDSKLAQELSKALLERGDDAEWDAAFKHVKTERTDDDRTEPMLHGSQHDGASPAASDADAAAAALEAVLASLEKTEREGATTTASGAVDAAPDAAAASPDSADDGGLVIDETTEEDKEQQKQKEALSSPKTVSAVEDVVVVEKEASKPDLAAVTAILSEVTDKKVREANGDTLIGSVETSTMHDVIPILVAPIFDVEDAPDDFVMKNKPYEYMFRLIRYATSTPDKFKTLRPRIPTGEISVAEAMDAAVEQVTAAVKAAVRIKGNGRVILFGWGLSCYINLRVVHLCHGISAVVNFAFSLKTLDGWRGTPDDDICLTYCPSLFVIGADAPDFDAVEFLMLRQNMIQSPGALVIGSADKNLNVSLLRLSRERITQKVADRIILEQVIEFINLRDNQLERAKLVPIQLNNVYFVEQAAVKSFTAQEAQQAMVTGGGKRSATGPHSADGAISAQSMERRRAQIREEKRKRSRLEEQTTAMGRLASSIASSAAPITKRSRTDDGLPSTSSSYGPARIGTDYRYSAGPSPLVSPSLASPGFRMMSRPAILSHGSHHHHGHQYGHQYHPAQPSPIATGPSSTSASGLLQTSSSTTRPANAPHPAPSPRGPLDPASISLS